MVGFILSIGLAISYVQLAWSGFEADFNFPAILAASGMVLVVGIVLFPKTVGIALTPVSMLTPVAFVIAWARLGIGDALKVLGLGLSAIGIAFLISALRPESTGRHTWS